MTDPLDFTPRRGKMKPPIQRRARDANESRSQGSDHRIANNRDRKAAKAALRKINW